MADPSYVSLISQGPYLGIDLTSAAPFIQPGYAASSQNANPTRIEGALTVEKGRQLMYNFSPTYLTSISVVFPVMEYQFFGPPTTSRPGYLVGGLLAGVFKAYVYYPRSGLVKPCSGAIQFDQAVQSGGVVYTNGGQRLFLNTNGNNDALDYQFYQWGYTPPAAAGNMTVTQGTAGTTFAAGTYYYVVTRMTTMIDGTVSETSVDLNQFASPPFTVVTGTGALSLIVTPINGFTWGGTNPDGTTYTSNLYRQSSNQPTYYLTRTGLTGAALYTDTLPDAALTTFRILQPQRDVPPTVANTYGTTGQNFCSITIHKNRVWVYGITTTTTNSNPVPQNTMWYSNLGVPWEFNQLTQVLLMNSDVTDNYVANTNTDYSLLYGNDPLAMSTVGSILCAFSRRQTWGIYGDDPNTFIQRQIFNIGVCSRHAVTPALGGVFLQSENGSYFFDGGAPQYDSESVRGAFRDVPNSPSIAPSDMAQSCGSFSNMTWYLSFPTLGVTYSYYTVTGKWLSVLPYAPAASGAIAYVPAHPNSYGGQDLNEVVAGRSSSAILDWWFADANLDLGLPQTFTFVSGQTDSGKRAFEKIYRYITLNAPIQPGLATVTFQTDPGAASSVTQTATFDLSGGNLGTVPNDNTTRHITSLGNGTGGSIRGFSAVLSTSVTGIVGAQAPQIWGVDVWGELGRNLDPRI